MKWMIEFTTEMFNSTETKPHFINDRCFGEDLIEWLIKHFDDPSFTLEKPFQEDWGWGTLARIQSETFSIGVGIMDDSIGEVHARWLLTVEKMRRFIIFGSKRSAQLDRLADEMEKIIINTEKITDVERYKES